MINEKTNGDKVKNTLELYLKTFSPNDMGYSKEVAEKMLLDDEAVSQIFAMLAFIASKHPSILHEIVSAATLFVMFDKVNKS